jgi:predicted DNA-binding mobile mystery protein A
MKTRQLMIKQMDRQLEYWRQTKNFFQPKQGWTRTLRKTLGMTTAQLANRLGVARSRVIKIEQAEQEDALTLRTLRETAAALNCDLVYAFVPKFPLQILLKQQAEKNIKHQLPSIAHSMLLEDQSVGGTEQRDQIEILVNELLSGSLKRLWNEK